MRAVLCVCVSLLLVSCVKPEQVSPKPAPVKVESAPADLTTPTAPPEKDTPTPVVTPTADPVKAPSNAAPTATPKAASAKESFVACGCGCCGGLEDAQRQTSCLYHAKGDSLEEIKKQDEANRKRDSCKVVGCSIGTKYEFCD